MKGAYDDLPQESWGRADSDMPQEYLNGILAQITPKPKPRPADHLDSIQKMAAIDAKLHGRQFPREGQPSFDAPLIEWYHERSIRWQIEMANL